MFCKSSSSLWSILCQINELPVDLKFKILLIAATWFAPEEPTCKLVQMYMRQFLESIKNLQEDGFYVSYEGVKLKVLVLPLFFSVHAKARNPMACRRAVAGYESCPWCNIHGKYDSGAVRFSSAITGFAVERAHAKRTIARRIYTGRQKSNRRNFDIQGPVW